ncbi:hypothetical protein ACVOMT_20255 (plasmid) [Sphingomonas panni]
MALPPAVADPGGRLRHRLCTAKRRSAISCPFRALRQRYDIMTPVIVVTATASAGSNGNGATVARRAVRTCNAPAPPGKGRRG